MLHPAQPHATEEIAPKRIYLLKPRGFCAGVVRAIDIVELALDAYGPPIYVRREIVHNSHVVRDLASRGAVFVEELDEVPEGGRVIYSAHGVAPAVRQMAVDRELKVIDATCPLVTKVHLEAVRFAAAGATILLIGHRDHDEVIGTLGEAPNQTLVVSTPQEARDVQVSDPDKLFYLTQTTLSLDDASAIIEVLKQRFPRIQGPPAQDICYATENRQQAVKHIAPRADLLLVVGSENSSNSRRLVEVGENAGLPGYLIDDEMQIQPAWLEGVKAIAITAGASAPEVLVQRVIGRLRQLDFRNVEEVEVIEEDVRFALPPELAPHGARLTQIANG
jgi:4-hydroxy-3-methylbut-2-enyl diphosphate reductase